MPQSLLNQFISDSYASILHLSGGKLTSGLGGNNSTFNGVYDGIGSRTGIALSGRRVIINGYVQPEGPEATAPTQWLDVFFPINSIKLTFDNVNPGSKILGTSWQLVSEGRFLVGVGQGADNQNPPVAKSFTAGDQDGEYAHLLVTEELPAHTHDIEEKVVGGNNPRAGVETGGSQTGGREQQGGVQYKTLNTGDNVAHNNTPPGYGIYVWRRIS